METRKISMKFTIAATIAAPVLVLLLTYAYEWSYQQMLITYKTSNHMYMGMTYNIGMGFILAALAGICIASTNDRKRNILYLCWILLLASPVLLGRLFGIELSFIVESAVLTRFLYTAPCQWLEGVYFFVLVYNMFTYGKRA